jgi:hypothetical protein
MAAGHEADVVVVVVVVVDDVVAARESPFGAKPT